MNTHGFYIVTMRRDSGTVDLRVYAGNVNDAIRKACYLEQSPLRSVVSIRKEYHA